MNRVVIPKSRIPDFLESLKSCYRVIAPIKDGEVLKFAEIKHGAEAVLSDEITYISPKEFLFPQVERFLHFDEDGNLHEEGQAEKTVIFGIRPCDLDALKVLTAVFTEGKFKDTLFENHKKNSILIGLGCLHEKPGCFCSERGINMDGSVECDLFLKDSGDHYIADIVTENGGLIIRNFLPDVQEVEKGDICVSEEAAEGDKTILEMNFDEDMLFHKVDWDRISETCIGCGTCTYICPTCHCFEFKDVAEKGTASRYRCWDSCMYPKFTLHASGHNPRSSKKERYRQRVLHKYLYVKQNFGYTACTGCGRCIRSCPAGISIRSVVKSIMEELT